ncbi:BZ3500_MvSof-1268-A1-R1_Chr9g10338 [Microbotryum saponariae]|uniref:BZ3500_MvSof-1268-A1-R1_Chr9g10338 protein n=1 Tax=Microbotryum saponariae TaxID=289078 RepID=A0A2X0L138_9BASI|nr:BZ3501_MvSof-1269-A2-R1_Chr9g10088 [Microbotryum saponariae]SCZ99923.1 BZ3500_MvSof-1268-A1-R1_Chr9g10338 [Microbotryum saponariae]
MSAPVGDVVSGRPRTVASISCTSSSAVRHTPARPEGRITDASTTTPPSNY